MRKNPSAGQVHRAGDARHANPLLAAAAFAAMLALGGGVIAAADAPAGGGLKRGEYACYGSSGLLIGLGFKVVDGSRYTDLDGKSAGTYAVNGDRVTFSGGHLAGQAGRNLKDGRFNLGMIGCEPFK